jgi:hypothetical protein
MLVGPNSTPLLARPETVTTILPIVAPFGTVAVMLVSLQFDGVEIIPLKVTVLLPWVPPKLDPEMVTGVPGTPTDSETPVMTGEEVTRKGAPLLPWPDTVTTTFPVVAPAGTVATMPVELQLDTVAAAPLKLTVLLPCVDPKPVPAIVT